MTKHLVIGLGEVGQALQKVFHADGLDRKTEEPEGNYKFLHIAFPYSKDFIEEVKRYQKRFNPKYTIIHSTVPIGTSEQCGANHSPVRGVHPYLKDSILTFKKFIGGPDCFELATEFRHFRIDCMCTRDARNTEALKLIDTTQYGYLIMLSKEIFKWCEEKGLDFNIIYTLGNKTYNEGYLKMFRDEVVRPYLEYRDEPIGGHCVIPNAKILEEYSPIHCAEWILAENAKLEQKLTQV